jgi:hypothetical protein
MCILWVIENIIYHICIPLENEGYHLHFPPISLWLDAIFSTRTNLLEIKFSLEIRPASTRPPDNEHITLRLLKWMLQNLI